MIKRFLSYYKPYKLLFFIDMASAIIIAACNLIYPSVVKNVINKYVPEGMLNMLLISSAVLLGIYLIKAACTYVVSYHGHIMGIKIQRDMRSDLFKKYQTLPTSFYDNNKTGDLLTRLVNDLFEVSELAHHGPENLIRTVRVQSIRKLFYFNSHITDDVFVNSEKTLIFSNSLSWS